MFYLQDSPSSYIVCSMHSVSVSLKILTFLVFLSVSLGKVPLQRAFDLIDYLKNESHAAPITEALFQTGLIFHLLEKVGHVDLASRLVVSLPFCQIFLYLSLILLFTIHSFSGSKKQTLKFYFFTLLIVKSVS